MQRFAIESPLGEDLEQIVEEKQLTIPTLVGGFKQGWLTNMKN